jgi:AhpD family alkylhydroperoxidase
MSEAVKAFYGKFKTDSGKIQQSLPDMAKGFMGLFQATMKDGALTVKQKELIALAIGIALRCEPCIYLHIQKCIDAGATREEILEAAAVVTMMQGGPGFVYTPKVLDALEALGK